MAVLAALAVKVAAAAIAGSAVVGGVAMASGGFSGGDSAVVVKVVDGDTVDATVNGVAERIRLLNVDTPETKDPDQPVQCLGPEATSNLERLLRPGDTVTLTYDVERRDRYGRLLAGVEKDDALINAEIARQGLGVAKVYEPNRRYYDEVLAAQREAQARGAGLYSATVACTLPGMTTAVEQTGSTGTPGTPDTMVGEADRLGGAAAAAKGVLAVFDGPRLGPVWDAFTPGDQSAFRTRIDSATRGMRTSSTEWRTRAETTRTAQADAARAAEESRLRVEAQVREEAAAQRRADAAARAAERRAAAEAAAQAEVDRRAASSSGSSSGSGAYPGYTGPRCYAPGGKTWRPC